LAVLLFHRIADKILENKDRKIKLEEKEKNLPWAELEIKKSDITSRRRRQMRYLYRLITNFLTAGDRAVMERHIDFGWPRKAT
jgi:hypothetical protein